MRHSAAQVVREYGPFDGIPNVYGVTFDGFKIWFADGSRIHGVDPESGDVICTIDVVAQAGTAFDGKYLWQLGEGHAHQIDIGDGRIVRRIPAPGEGDYSGMAWAEGFLWIGEHGNRFIHQVDPVDGTILRTIASDSTVTGVCFLGGDLWHGTSETKGSDIRRVDKNTGQIHEIMVMPTGVDVTGIDSNGCDRFFVGGGSSGTIRAVLIPPTGSSAV